jgi:hypothetical protein
MLGHPGRPRLASRPGGQVLQSHKPDACDGRRRLRVGPFGPECASKHGPDSRRPPPCAAVGGWCSARVQVSCDLSEAPARGVLCEDPLDELGRQGRRPPASRRLRSSSSWSSLFSDEALQLIYRDETCAPGHLDRLDRGQYAPVEGRAADPERFRRLCARVCQPFDAHRLADDLARRGRRSVKRRCLSLCLRALAAETAA